MSFPHYPNYKDSGVEWLGEVPDHWKIYKLQDLAKKGRYSFVDGPFGSDLKNEEYTESGVPLIQLNNITEGAHVLNDIKYVSDVKADQLAKHNAFPGDVVLAKMADPVARAALVRDSFDRYVIVADCIRLSVDETVAVPSFAVYAINSPYFRSHAVGRSSGITRLRINLGTLKQIRLVLPSHTEQTQIAAFLDRETAKIDELVAEQRRLMELLKEKRQAVISHAVTKGLNPDAPMKPSGIEWLGDVPAHWEVGPVKHHIARIESGTSVNSSDEPAEDGNLGVLKTSCVYTGKFEPDQNKTVVLDDIDRVSCPLKAGTLIVSRMNTPELIGAAGLVISAPSNLFLPDRLWQISFADTDAHFVHFWALTTFYRAQVESVCTGTSPSMKNLGQDQFGSFVIAMPPRDEQEIIASFLECETTQFDTLTAEAQRAINLLQERRTALISAAVTGQIDVRQLTEKQAA